MKMLVIFDDFKWLSLERLRSIYKLASTRFRNSYPVYWNSPRGVHIAGHDYEMARMAERDYSVQRVEWRQIDVFYPVDSAAADAYQSETFEAMYATDSHTFTRIEVDTTVA